jgi:hypothetical protein
MLARIFVAASVLAGPTDSFARGVHFGIAPPACAIRSGAGGAGFLDRHVFFKSLAGPRVVFMPYGYPYAGYSVFSFDPDYVALP